MQTPVIHGDLTCSCKTDKHKSHHSVLDRSMEMHSSLKPDLNGTFNYENKVYDAVNNFTSTSETLNDDFQILTSNSYSQPVFRGHGYMIGVTVLLAIFILSTVLGNIFVLTAIKIERSLHNSSYYLIMSLALTDLTVAVLAMPFGLVDELSEIWFLGRYVCETWITFDVLCCTSSILHLMFISFDRYWSVTNVSYVNSNKGKAKSFTIYSNNFPKYFGYPY